MSATIIEVVRNVSGAQSRKRERRGRRERGIVSETIRSMNGIAEISA
ncbi:MAG: hypothetical protein HS130_05750 [Deltaproteobacteria bacterium]|nr:hypothetical protein [Deltaproteobacteria bacterium]